MSAETVATKANVKHTSNESFLIMNYISLIFRF
jgi:hypothetical protein